MGVMAGNGFHPYHGETEEKPGRPGWMLGGGMKRTALVLFVSLIIAAVALIAGCGGDGESTSGDDGGVGEGKAQALVFTQPG